MTLAQMIQLAIAASIFMIVFAIGLEARFQDASLLLRRPRLLLRSIFAMNVVMVVFAIAIVMLFDLHPAIEIAIVAIAVSPVPPIFPKKQHNAGGSDSYAVGLLVAAVVLSFVLIPTWTEILGYFFPLDQNVTPWDVAPVVFRTVLVPLLAGMLVRRFWTKLADRIARPSSLAGMILLLVAVVPALIHMWSIIWSLAGTGVIPVVGLFTLVGLAVGHFFGGPVPEERTVLAIATSTRHPGITLAIAKLTFPTHQPEVMAVVVCYLLAATIFAIPYMVWRARVHAARVAEA